MGLFERFALVLLNCDRCFQGKFMLNISFVRCSTPVCLHGKSCE